MHFETLRRVGTAGLLTLALGGCAYGPDNVDAQFGNAVRNMIAVQRFETGKPAYDGEGIDPVKGQQAFRAYQGDVGEPKHVDGQVLKIDFGQQ